MKRLTGISASRGIAIGQVRFFSSGLRKAEPVKADDIQCERTRYAQARERAGDILRELYQYAQKELGPKESIIFEIHRMLIEDEDYNRTIIHLIEEGYTAEYAVQQAEEKFSQMFREMEDDYMRARHVDIRDISERIQAVLGGQRHPDWEGLSKGQYIIAANDLTPSEILQLDQDQVLACITRNGSRISHSGILARKTGIPAIVMLGEEQFAQLDEQSIMIVDGTEGVVIVNPDERILSDYREKRDEYMSYRQRLKTMRGAASETLDGVRVEVRAEISTPAEVEDALTNDAHGIGLFRSEQLLTESDGLPSETVQFGIYRSMLREMEGHPVTISTFDLSEHKGLVGFGFAPEGNPKMGCRGLRLSLRNPDTFLTQIRALLRASVCGPLLIQLPMVTNVHELRAAKSMIYRCMEKLAQSCTAFDAEVRVGVSVETPACALQCDELAGEADFFAINLALLTQHTLAVDRENASVSALYDPRHEAVFKLVHVVARAAQIAEIECGIYDLPGNDPWLIERFLRAGISVFTVEPSQVLAVREQVRGITLWGDEQEQTVAPIQ